jgi:hypothetical protein
VPWQAGADVHADGHVHPAFGPEWILEVLRISGGEGPVPVLRPEDDAGCRHECETGWDERIERVVRSFA